MNVVKLLRSLGKGVTYVFYKLILFYTVFTKLQFAFYSFKKFELFFEIWPIKIGPHNRYLMGRKNENGKKSLFHLKSISFFIFQAILYKFLGNVPYIITKICYLWILIILKNKNFMTKIKLKMDFFFVFFINFCHKIFIF